MAGLTFAFQGANYLGGSALTRNPFWLFAGAVFAVLGVILLVGANAWNARRPKMALTSCS